MHTRTDSAPSDARDLEAAFANNPDGLWLSSENGTTLRVNRAYEQISGYPSEELVGRQVQDMVAEGKFRHSAVVEVLRRRRSVRILNITGTGRRLVVTGTPLFDRSGRVWRVLCNVRDIAEIARLQREVPLESFAGVDPGDGKTERVASATVGLDGVVGRSAALKHVLETADRAALCDLPVCITGPSGVGKEMIAERIHSRSPRRQRPFVRLNCAAIPDALAEAELFGYERGSFTGALPVGRPGQFEVADGGTLLLDEVGELSPAIQAKLLRILNDLRVQRVGGRTSRQVDVRIVAASNRDLAALVRDGAFRADLYYRLHVLPIEIPPLAARRDDIPPLADLYLDRCAAKYGRRHVLTPSALQVLVDYPWPGNVRELRNEIERLAVMVPGGRIEVSDLSEHVRRAAPIGQAAGSLPTLRAAAWRAEAQVIEEALRRYGSLRGAARALGVTHVTLLRKTRLYGLCAEESPGGLGKTQFRRNDPLR